MRIDEAISNLRTKVEGVGAGVAAVWDAFKGNTGMIPKEEQTIGNLKYAIRMNQEEMDVNEINFVDFNGMVLSMTIEEVMQLTEMPKPNEYYNLTFEHWTKSLEEIQDGRCHTIGATYHTTDGCNYFIVEVKDGEQVTLTPASYCSVSWGDGTSNNTGYSTSHIYEKGGRYVIKVIGDTKRVNNEGELLCATEIYLRENANLKELYLRNNASIRKLCVPDNGTALNYGNFQTQQVNKLKAIVTGSGGLYRTNIMNGATLPRLEYLVAGNDMDLYELKQNGVSLKCLEINNVKEIANSTGGIFPWLRYISFDKIETIGAKTFGASNTYAFEKVDLSDTIKSIGNQSFLKNVNHLYIRSLTPPTLGGTSVFWNAWHGHKTTIHIRKEATYTDAAGTTYTGLEAYAHATNWATLYANTNYTFIDDL